MKIRITKVIIAVILFLSPNMNFGQAPPLGATETFALFTAVGAFTNDGATLVIGDIGTNVGAFSGFPPGTVIGNIHVADAVSAQAATDVAVAYSFLAGLTCGTVLGTTLGSGQMLLPDIYCLGGASTINGELILDAAGDPDAIFIFQIDGALSTTVLSSVTLINGASLCNVFWQINGAVSLGEGSVFRGTIIANGAITLLESASLIGRGLSQAGAIDLHNNIVNVAMEPVASTITANGPTTFCVGGSVVLSGNVDGVWSTGEITPTITVTMSGDYYVTNTENCGSINSNHIIVTVNPFPVAAVITAGGPIIFCAGGSVILSGNINGVWSTGATTASITVTASGDYFVTNTNSCGSVTSNHIIVTVNPLPVASVITASGAIIFCVGGSVILSGNVGGVWSTGATTASITVTASGNYSVTNTNSCGSVTSNHIIVTVNPLPSCVITGDGIVCAGNTIQLCAPTGISYTYLWSTTATTKCITVSVAGTYTVTVTNANGCSSVCSKVVTSMSGSCSITGKLQICGTCMTQLCVTPATSYIWNTGAVTRCIYAFTPGTYAVTITSSNGCTSSCSVVVTLYCPPRESSDLNIAEASDGNIEINVHPNPFTSKAIFEFQNTESNSHVMIELYNLKGNKINTLYDSDIEKGTIYTAELNSENLTEGIYMYRLVNGNQIINGKLVLIR